MAQSSQRKYTTAQALRMALEERLLRMSVDKGVDLMRLRRQVAFDRLLSRLFQGGSTEFVLKGGYAMELRIQKARTTKDIDLSFNVSGDRKTKPEFSDKMDSALEIIRKKVSDDLGDFFEFFVADPVQDLEAVPYAGKRYPVECRLAGRTFIKFHLDVVVGDHGRESHEMLYPKNFLEFAGIGVNSFISISPEQQFAEKLHAYTLPRERPNSRVKDLIDLYLLLDYKELDPDKLKKMTNRTFSARKTHELPSELEAPPDFWQGPFEAMAEESGIPGDINSAFSRIASFCSQIRLI